MDEPSIPKSPNTKAYMPGRRVASLQMHWLILVWILWVGVCVLTLLIVVASLRVYAALLQTICISSVCPDGQLTPVTAHELSTIGLSVRSYATWRLVFSIIWMLVWSAVATLLAWRRRNEWYVLLVALMCILLGSISITNTVAQSPSPWQWPAISVHFLGFILLFLVILLFPDGRFVPRWTRWVVAVFLLQSVCYNFFPTVTFQLTAWTPILGGLLWIGILLTTLTAQIYRYRYVSDTVQRQQTKWVVFGFAVVGLAEMGATLLLLLFPSLGQPGSLFFMAFESDSSFILLFIPLTFGIAIQRYRLWDIDIIINRTLVYGGLTVCIVGMYVFVVGYLGALFHTSGNLLISLIAAGLVAVAFQPLRMHLQRGINRLLYGLRDEPYVVLTGLGQRLQATLDLDAMLSTIVQTVREALKLSYAAIEVKEGTTFVLAASSGTPPAKEALRLPLLHRRELVGTLLIAPRRWDDVLTPADLRLLDDLADQIGIAVHTVHLTTDLQSLAADLQRSREHLVTAREEERRRLRRDLHDGLGPTLATITVKAEAARDVIAAEPAQATLLLEEIIGQAQTAITDIRRLVYNLRPPAIDDLGLVAAIRGQAMRAEHPGLRISIEAPQHLPELSAAVEVAAYRIMQEAVTNVVRHARARSCLIRLTCDSALHLEVTDDGCGIPADRQAGIGLRSMQERAVEVGGSCVVEALPSKGTRVQACLPCASDETHSLQKRG